METRRYWTLMVLALAALAVVVANIVLLSGNRLLRTEVSERNLYIQQSLQLEGLYQQLLRTLAELSVQNNDAHLRQLLASQGISVQVTPPPAAVAPQLLALPESAVREEEENEQ